ncbi:MAG: transporter substrate-binding domain-containing protein [Gammaproteobacteria bacterium]|nr:transporter substrate-binding domain-containing protein [Gammaproteobacteria bacterium]
MTGVPQTRMPRTGISLIRFSVFRTILLLTLAWTALPAVALDRMVTVSTNNTPLDRRVLEVVASEALQRLGYGLEVISLPSERSLRTADQGEVDGEGLRVAGLGELYPNLIQVPEPFVRISFVAFSRDATIELNGWDSLRDHRVAFINGWKMFESHATHARSVTKVDQPQQLFNMLASSRVDLALYTKADGEVLIREQGLTSIAPLSPSLKDVDMYLYLHRKHEALVPELAATIRALKADGTYNTLVASIRAR